MANCNTSLIASGLFAKRQLSPGLECSITFARTALKSLISKSLYPPFIEAGSSDLYVLPRFSTAFLDPFAEIPTLSMLCSYFNKDGEVVIDFKYD